MIAIVSDREALWAAVMANPRDAAPKLVLADWLDEYGRTRGDADLSRGLRWAAEKRWWPEASGIDDIDPTPTLRWSTHDTGRPWPRGKVKVFKAVCVTHTRRFCGCFAIRPVFLVRRVGRALAVLGESSPLA